jgi:hypothetical protein
VTSIAKKEGNGEENKIPGFLMGLGAGTIGYLFLSLFEKPKCSICKIYIQKNTKECPNCHSKLSWR